MPLGGTRWIVGRSQLQKNQLRQRGPAQLSGEPAWTAGEPPARPCLVRCHSLHTQHCPLEDCWTVPTPAHITLPALRLLGAVPLPVHTTVPAPSHLGAVPFPAHTNSPASRILASRAVCAARNSWEDDMLAPSATIQAVGVLALRGARNGGEGDMGVSCCVRQLVYPVQCVCCQHKAPTLWNSSEQLDSEMGMQLMCVSGTPISAQGCCSTKVLNVEFCKGEAACTLQSIASVYLLKAC